MFQDSNVTTQDILEVFSEAIAERAGDVLDVFDDGGRFFARSILPRVEEARPRDRLQGGVAVRGSESEIWAHPYVFRQVCRNGAIMAQTLETRHVARLDELPREDADRLVREAVEVCCSNEAFSSAVDQIRSATEAQADVMLALMSHVARLPPGQRESLLAMIFDRFQTEGDASRFGLMNAVTSVARDTRDPELRWRLEELGGGIPAMLAPELDDSGEAAEYRLDLLVG